MLGYQLVSAIETKRRKNFKEKVLIAVGWEGNRERGTGREGCELPEHVCLLLGDLEGSLGGAKPEEGEEGWH